MTLYTIGPVEMFPETLSVRSKQVPYFRNEAFSEVVLSCEGMHQALAGAPEGARTVFLTCSGTGAMEATVMNCLGEGDRALVICGGSFGQRFSHLLDIHGIMHTDLVVADGKPLLEKDLRAYDGMGFTHLVVNLDETSTGQLYDLSMLADFCGRNDALLVVDAISSYLADPIDMSAAGIDALIVSSQKALGLAPGLSLVTLSPRMLEKVDAARPRTMYFDFKDYLRNGTRGQTPFTPAVGVVYELRQRLGALVEAGGSAAEVARGSAIAQDFRSRGTELPVLLPGYPLSNALTPLVLPAGGARRLLDELEGRYSFVLNPCGGAHADDMVRVAHVGNHTVEENAQLVDALKAVL